MQEGRPPQGSIPSLTSPSSPQTSCATSTVSLLAPLVPPPDPTPVLLGDDLIGSSLLWDGFFGPVLIFDTVLSSAQLSAECNDFNATQELAKPPSPSQTPSHYTYASLRSTRRI